MPSAGAGVVPADPLSDNRISPVPAEPCKIARCPLCIPGQSKMWAQMHQIRLWNTRDMLRHMTCLSSHCHTFALQVLSPVTVMWFLTTSAPSRGGHIISFRINQKHGTPQIIWRGKELLHSRSSTEIQRPYGSSLKIRTHE